MSAPKALVSGWKWPGAESNCRYEELSMNRVSLLLLTFRCLVGVHSSRANQPDFRLEAVPAIVYKVDDPGGASASSFVFNIAVICSTDCDLTPISARVELSSAGSAVDRQDWTREKLAKIKRISYRIEPNTPLASPTRAFTLPEAFDVRFIFVSPRHWRLTPQLSGSLSPMRRAVGRNRR